MNDPAVCQREFFAGFILMAAVTVVWALVGYSLAFDVGSPYFGGMRFAMLRDRFGVGWMLSAAADPNPGSAA